MQFMNNLDGSIMGTSIRFIRNFCMDIKRKMKENRLANSNSSSKENRYFCKKGPKMDCNKKKNLEKCNCTYEPCSRKGICCECLAYHLDMKQLPGCCFPKGAEATYDRSFRHFAKLVDLGTV